MRVLKHPRGGLEALLEIAGGSESEWVELKATTHPQDGHFENGDNEDDYRWDVARAVIALANSIGGVVLLGVDDKGKPFGLEASDPDGKRVTEGAEAFRRKVILQQVLNPGKGWRTGRRGTFKVSAQHRPLLERLVTLEEVRCGEKFALAILVDPVPRGYGHVVVEKTTGGNSVRVVYARKRGAVGEIIELPIEDPAVLRTHDGRHTRYEQETGLAWDRFLASVRIARPAQELIPEIQRYLGRITNQLSWVDGVFTPLDAERLEIAGVEPEAAESEVTPGSDADWLRESSQPNPAAGDDAVELLTPDHALQQELVTDLLDERRRAVLIGEAGSGKSTCFKKLALSAAEQWKPGRASTAQQHSGPVS